MRSRSFWTRTARAVRNLGDVTAMGGGILAAGQICASCVGVSVWHLLCQSDSRTERRTPMPAAPDRTLTRDEAT